MNEQEYLANKSADYRYEFYNGEAFMVPDHSNNHTLAELNIIQLLQNYLTGENAIPFASNLRVCNTNKMAYTYPELIVFSEQPDFMQHEILTVTNPYLVIEIFESSKPAYDPSVRFDLYQNLQSFKEYVIVDADSTHVIALSDHGEEWLVQEASNIQEVVHSHAINFTFKLADIYRNIEVSSGK